MAKFGSNLFRWMHNKVFKPISAPIGSFGKAGINMVSGGAVERAEQNAEALRDAKEQKENLEDSRARNWDNTLRSADIAARQQELAARGMNEQSRAAEINAFQQESEATHAMGQSGLLGGSSPYMAMEASIGEARRQINQWFESSSEQLGMQGEQTAMAMGNARFSDKVAGQDLRKLNRGIEGLQENLNPLNVAMDFAGGVMSSMMFAYGLQTNIGLGMEMLKNGGGIGDIFKMSSNDILRMGTAYKYARLTGDKSMVENFKIQGVPSMQDQWGGYGSKASQAWDWTKQAAGQTWDWTKDNANIWGTRLGNDLAWTEHHWNKLFPANSEQPLQVRMDRPMYIPSFKVDLKNAKFPLEPAPVQWGKWPYVLTNSPLPYERNR